MKKILMLSILVTFFASCGHMYGHKHHGEASSCCSCKGGCSTDKEAKTDVKKDKKECEDCKKAS